MFTDQQADGAAVTAQITVTASGGGCSYDDPAAAHVQTIALQGAGGAVDTSLPIYQAITSSGPLGDLTLRGGQGLLADVTAPSILGNINVPDGPIASTIQTTFGGYWPGAARC